MLDQKKNHEADNKKIDERRQELAIGQDRMMAILRDEPLLTYFTDAPPFAEPIELQFPTREAW